MARIPLLGNRHSICANPSGVTPICGSGQLSFAHKKKGQRSQRFKHHGRLVRVVLDKLAEIVEPVRDCIESEQSEDSNDLLVRYPRSQSGVAKREASSVRNSQFDTRQYHFARGDLLPRH